MIEKLKKHLENELFLLIYGFFFFITALILDLCEIGIAATVLYIIALLVCGTRVFLSAIKGILSKDLLDEKFLMSVASIGAMIIGDMTEGVAVMLFFLLGELFEHKAVQKSRKSIKSLMQMRPDLATVIVDGKETATDAEDVEIGSEIVIRAGERVPIDSVVITGNANVDTSMLTGESAYFAAAPGAEIKSGCVALDGVLYAKTIRLAEESGAQRILELVENATENKSREENFITVFSRIYTPIVVGISVIMAIFLPLIFDSVSYLESVYRALTFLVISCPCALVISVPMAFFGGIGGAASNGILFKGGNVFSPLAKADVFAFDKTGTLTEGNIRVEKIIPYSSSEEEIRFFAASAEYASNHPISLAVRSLCENAQKPENVREISGKGVVAEVLLSKVLVGNSLLLSEYEIEIENETEGAVYVAVNGTLAGAIILGDSVKKNAKASLLKLKKSGVKSNVMLSGDKREKAISVAEAIGVDEVYYELLPEDKYQKLEKIKNESKKVAFVGDGINDAPSLAFSDVGIAMGAIGSDSAIEAADVVIMTDNLDRLPLARRIAKKTLKIAKENIAFALFVKFSILAFSAVGYADMWLSVFADVGVAVIAILNSMRTLFIGKEK